MLKLHKLKKRTEHLSIVPSETGLAVADLNFDDRHPSIGFCDFSPWDSSLAREETISRYASKHKLKRRPCATVLPSRDYTILTLEAPDVPQEEWADAIRWNIADMVDFDTEKAIIEVFPAPEINSGNRKQQIYAVVTRQEVIQACTALINEAQVKLETIDIPELVLRNIAIRLPEDAQGVALVHMTHDRGMVLISRKGQLYFARTMDFGLDDLLANTAETSELSLVTDSPFDHIVLEIQRSLDYYDRYFSQPPVNCIVFTPMATPVPGLFDSIQQSIDQPVRELDLHELVAFDDELNKETQANCIVAIGAALRHGADPAGKESSASQHPISHA